MEPFTILCSTCQSRIRVRNANMLGQIANCPKCDSMILIAAPPKLEVPAASGTSVDSMAMTKEGIPVDAPTAELPPLAASVDGEAAPPPVEVEQAELAATAEHASGPVEWQPSSPALVPSEQWTSPTATRTRQYLLVGFFGVGGVALAAVLFFVFLNWYADSKSRHDALAQSDPDVLAASAIDSDMPAAEADAPATAKPSEGLGDTLAAELPSDEVLSSELPSSTLPQPISDGLSQPVDTSTKPAAVSAEPAASLPTATAADPMPSELPADLEPAADLMPQPDNTAAASTPAAETDSSLPRQLQNFAPMLQWQVQPQLPDALEVLSAAPPTAEELGLPTGDAALQVPPIDWQSHSQTTVPGLIVEALPLSRLINLWTNISGVPTGVQLDSLAAANRDRTQPVKLGMLRSVTLEQLVKQLSTQSDLTIVPQENRFLMVSASHAAIRELLPATYPLDGLLAEEAAAEQWLLTTLDVLLPQSAGQWQIEQHQLRQPAQADMLTWFAAVRLLENWRMAADLPTALPAYEARHLAQPFVKPEELLALDQPLQEILPQSRPVAQILPRLCAEAGLEAWIDWPHVGDVGLGPQSTSLVVTHARPLRRALADYVDQFSLVASLIDAQTLWFTSPAAYRAQPQLYVLPSEDRTPEQWQEQLRPLTPAGANGVESVIVEATPDGRFVLVRCCRPALSFR